MILPKPAKYPFRISQNGRGIRTVILNTVRYPPCNPLPWIQISSQNSAQFFPSGSLNTARLTDRFPLYGPWCLSYCFAFNLDFGSENLLNFVLWIYHHEKGNGPSSSKRS